MMIQPIAAADAQSMCLKTSVQIGHIWLAVANTAMI